jgi:hypothetical protein
VLLSWKQWPQAGKTCALLTTMAHTAGWPMIRLQGVTSRAFCILLYDAEATGRPPAELQHHHDKMSAHAGVSAV